MLVDENDLRMKRLRSSLKLKLEASNDFGNMNEVASFATIHCSLESLGERIDLHFQDSETVRRTKKSRLIFRLS